jgi:YidC/Oxa1 family membrane protein insertase
MDRKGIIAVTLSVIILAVWWVYNDKEMKKLAAAHAAQVEADKAKAGTDARAPGGAATPPATTATTPAPETAPPPPAAEEKTEELPTTSVNYTFTNLGGGIKRARLNNHEAERGKQMVLNEFGAIPIGTITEAAGQGVDAPFTAQVNKDNGEIVFERTDSRQVQLSKRFVVPKSTDRATDYIVELEATFTNKGTQPVTLPGYYVHTGSAAPVHEHDQMLYTGFKRGGGKFIDASWFEKGWFTAARPVFTESASEIPWAGVANQYFTSLVTPRVEGPNVAQLVGKRGVSAWATRFDIPIAVWKEAGRTSTNDELKHYGVTGAIGMPSFTLEPGKSLSQKFAIYAGPRENGRLRLMKEDQEDILGFYDVGGLFAPVSPIIGFCSKILLTSLNAIHAGVESVSFLAKWSYGYALILLTLVIKTLLWPMQNKATNSMKRMGLLQPKMQEIRDKYKDDPTRMNTEVMKLYKDYGVNPLSGCLPMLIQIPIFFGFYNMLGKAVELRNSKFLWVDDLSLPDTVWHFPWVGWPLNILPLLMAATMFWQMSLSPKSGDPMQQRIFMFMPLIFIAFCYNFASALALYWTVQNLFSVVQLYATRNQAPPTLQKVTAPPKKK